MITNKHCLGKPQKKELRKKLFLRPLYNNLYKTLLIKNYYRSRIPASTNVTTPSVPTSASVRQGTPSTGTGGRVATWTSA